MSTKRGMEANGEQGMKKARTEEGSELQEIRVLIDNYEASVIIGKAGANVKKIRQDSSAFVSILKTEGSSKERVMQIKGTVEFNAHALRLIAALLIDNDNERKADPENVLDQWTFKLLVHKSLAGAIIGKGGEIIRTMQSESGARVSLSTEPVAASTEKTVTVTGSVENLHDVCTRILTQVRDNPVRPGTTSILYVPGQQMSTFGAPPQSPYGMPPQSPYGMPPQSPYGMPQQMGNPGLSKTEKIVIPTVCAGTVIGKGGSIIREIKMQSGTNISVAAPEPTAPNDRVVSITGPAQGIQTAIFLIRQRVESYQPPGGMSQMYE